MTTTVSDPLLFIQGSFLLSVHALFSNTLLHIHTIPYIHARELPSTTTDIHCWPLSSFTGALLIHFPHFTASPIGFHSLRISLFQKPSCSHSKLVRRSYIKRQQRLIGPVAHCGFDRVTVHHNGSSVNWKSVFYLGARLKCGVLCFRDKDSGRWRDTRGTRSEEGEERRGPKAKACWVAIQRLQGVTGRRRCIVQLCESGLKACIFPLQGCQRQHKKELYKVPTLVSKGLQERVLMARGGYRFNL